MRPLVPSHFGSSYAFPTQHSKIGTTQLSREFTLLKKQPEFQWLQALPRQPFSQVLRDLDRVYTNFFKKRAKPPRFKKRAFAGTCRFTLDQRRNQVDREVGRVQLDGVGKVRIVITEPLEGRLRSVTVSRDSAGRYFASITADRVPAKPITVPSLPAVGLDQGVKDLLVTSTNDRTPVSRALQVRAQRLRRYQRSQSRKMRVAMIAAGLDPRKRIPKGTKLAKSQRFERDRIRIARLHAKIRDARPDLLHQATTTLVDQHALIGIETLNVKGMQRGLARVRRRIGNACLGSASFGTRRSHVQFVSSRPISTCPLRSIGRALDR